MTHFHYPALHASHAGVWIADARGTREIGRGEAIALAGETPVVLLNAPLVGQRLGYPELSGLDLLELFAFVHPARFAVPTIGGLARVLGLEAPTDESTAAGTMIMAAEALTGVARSEWPEREGAWTSLQTLARLRWPWANVLAGVIAKPERGERWLFSKLPEWEELPPRPQPRTVVIEPADALMKLESLTGADAERREGQRAYVEAAAGVFSPRARRDEPNMLLAEAGTGIGKTLGYLSPASLWAEQAAGTVWVSTFTKALQRQLDGETVKLFADPDERKQRVVVRKGRENYLCLLNLEDGGAGGIFRTCGDPRASCRALGSVQPRR